MSKQWFKRLSRRWFKRWLKCAALAFTVMFLLWGCQTISSQPDSNPDQVTIKLSGWGSSPAENRLFQQVLRHFEAEHPTITVQFDVIADQYMDVMKTRLIGDAAPDVFFLEAFEAPLLMQSGVLQPLDQYITPAFDLADFADNLLSPFRYHNQIYGLPKDFSTLALFYNRSALTEAGISAPPQTWDDLLADAKRLTIDRNQDGKPDQYGFGMLPELARQAFVVQAFGGQVVDAQGYAAFATENGLKGLDLLVEQYRRDRTAARPQDVGTSSGIEMFGQAKAAMVIEGNWAIPYLADTFPELDYGTAEVPEINNQPGTMAYTVAYVMSHQSTHKPEAWALIAYLTGKAGMKQWTGTGLALPTRRSVAQQLNYQDDPLRSALIAGIRYATPWQIGEHATAIMNHFNNQFLSALLGEQPLSHAMQQAQESANRQIKAAE